MSKLPSTYILHHKQAYEVGILFIFLTNWLAVSIPLYLGENIDLFSGGTLIDQQDALVRLQGPVWKYCRRNMRSLVMVHGCRDRGCSVHRQPVAGQLP